MEEHDLIIRESQVGPRRTVTRLLAAVRERGLKVFARVDHAAGAEAAGLELRPTELIVFGDARAGTPLMQADQKLGIDLPLRALVWLDAEGKTQAACVDPIALLRRRCGRDSALEALAQAMATLLEAVLAEATGPITDDERLDEAVEETFPASDSSGLGADR